MSDRSEIIRLYRAENQAMVGKDIATLNKILDQSMTLTHMTGYVQPKLEWIDQIQNEQMKYYSSQEDQIKDIKIGHDAASLIGQNQVRASIWGGGINTWPLQMKVYFKKEHGRWLIAKQVASTY